MYRGGFLIDIKCNEFAIEFGIFYFELIETIVLCKYRMILLWRMNAAINMTGRYVHVRRTRTYRKN